MRSRKAMDNVKFNVIKNSEKTIIECARCRNKLIELLGESSMSGMGCLSCRKCDDSKLIEKEASDGMDKC